MEYIDRFYRKSYIQNDLLHFQAAVEETDLNIGVNKDQYSKDLVIFTKKAIKDIRRPLEEYIKKDPKFLTALEPYELLDGAPEIAKIMADAGSAVNVGPMASVAGAIADAVGKALTERCREVIVENGGDIYMKTDKIRRVGIFAGESVLSGLLAIEIKPEETPIGICTSSAKVGPSLSFGNTDAVAVLSNTAAAADAAATACGNIVKTADDIEKALDYAGRIKSIYGILIIIGDHLGVRGNIRLLR